MKKTILLIVLSMLLLCAMAAPALAQPLVGVEVGDWFKYEVKVTEWVSDMEFLPEDFIGPLTLADNETNYQLYTVTGIVDDVINFTVTYDWKNGSVTYADWNENLTFSMGMLAIGADMTEGEMVRDTFLFLGFYQWPALYLNAPIMLVNPDATRETNVCEYSIDIYGSLYDYLLYWDKATGMRVYYENHGDVGAVDTQSPYVYTVKWELVDSSVDGLLVPDLTGPVMLAAFIAITVPIVLYKRKKLHI